MADSAAAKLPRLIDERTSSMMPAKAVVEKRRIVKRSFIVFSILLRARCPQDSRRDAAATFIVRLFCFLVALFRRLQRILRFCHSHGVENLSDLFFTEQLFIAGNVNDRA